MFRYNIHDILFLESQYDLLPLPFLVHKEFDRTPDLRIQIREDSFFLDHFDSAAEIMPGIFFQKRENQLISKIQIFQFKCFLAIRDFDKEGGVILSMNKPFITLTQNIIRQPFSSLFPLEHFLKLMIGLVLLKKEAVLVISAAFRFLEKNFMISAFGGIGKTTLTLNAYQKGYPGFRFLSDDTCILYNGQVYGFPQKIRERCSGPIYFSKLKYSNPISVFGNCLNQKFIPDYLVFLERSNGLETENLDPKSASIRLTSITDKILPYPFERHIAALDYIYGFSDQFRKRTRDALTQCLAIPGVIIRGRGNDYMKQLKHLATQEN